MANSKKIHWRHVYLTSQASRSLKILTIGLFPFYFAVLSFTTQIQVRALQITKMDLKEANRHPELRSTIITQAMQEFVQKEEEAAQGAPQSLEVPNSNLSGALSMALCCIQPTNSSCQFLTAWMYVLNVLPLAYTEVGYFKVLASLQ